VTVTQIEGHLDFLQKYCETGFTSAEIKATGTVSVMNDEPKFKEQCME
jgi:hypothetical protein